MPIQRCREQWHVAVVTKLRADMKLVPPFVAWNQTACAQGQPLEWLGYVARQDRHWFGVTDPLRCALGVGRPRSVRDNLLMLPANMKLCWDCCR